MKILMIDDNASVRLTMSAILEDHGHEVVEASSFAEGRACIAEPDVDYDLVLLDLHLDTGIGTDLIPEIRQLRPGTKVAIVSGSAGAEYVGGADALFEKGTDPELFVAEIERLVLPD